MAKLTAEQLEQRRFKIQMGREMALRRRVFEAIDKSNMKLARHALLLALNVLKNEWVRGENVFYLGLAKDRQSISF